MRKITNYKGFPITGTSTPTATYSKCALFKACPEAARMWDYDKNKFTPDEVGPCSSKEIWWKCENGHSFKDQAIAFVRRTHKCPECRRISFTIAGKPYMMKFWDYNRNAGADPSTIMANDSKTRAFWKCPNCGYEWDSVVSTRKDDLCPCCDSNIAIWPGVNDFLTVMPDAEPDLVGPVDPNVDAQRQGVGSHEKMHWKCAECGYEWDAPVYSRIKPDGKGGYYLRGCPACSGCASQKSMDEKYPELIPLYDASNPLKLSEIPADYSLKYRWRCPKHGVFEAVLSSMIRAIRTGNNGCPYCHGTKVRKSESFGAKYPELAAEWSEENDRSPYEVTENSKYKAVWQCTKGHKWKATVGQRSHGWGNCPYCYPSGKAITPFAATYPEIKKYYSSKNTTPFELLIFSSRDKLLWNCDKGHEYEETTYNIHQRGGRMDCPICNYRIIIPGVNDLEHLYPEVAALYDEDRNELKACEISPKSIDGNTYWICPEGHSYQRSVFNQVFGTGKCPICERRIITPGINDLATTDPDIAAELSPKNTVDASMISRYTSKYYIWKCSKCGNEYKSTPNLRVFEGDGCPYCTGEKPMAGVNDLATTDPELAKEWSDENARGPETYFKTSSAQVKWVCPVCGATYSRRINEREVGDHCCPCCNGTKVFSGINDIEAKDPALAKEWSPNNIIPPNKVKRDSAASFKWICPTCGGEYSYVVRDREVGDDSCPYCAGEKPLAGFNDLATTHPELAKEWSDENARGPETYFKTSSAQVKWDCPVCGATYTRRISERKVGDHCCPCCNGTKVYPGINDIETLDPALAKEWSPNNKVKPSEVKRDSTAAFKWICPTCSGEYSYVVCDREVGDDSCPFCAGERLLTGFNDLATTDPELAKEWSDLNDRKPNTVMKSSNLYAYWDCPVCGATYTRRISEREVGDHCCPCCNGTRVYSGINDIETLDPALAKEWSPNNKVKPSEVKRDSAAAFKWICPTCSGEYSYVVCDREVGDDSCPFCAGERLLTGFNDLATTDPELAKEWADTNDRTPDTVMKRNIISADWKCPTCGGIYPALICDREVGDDSCPFCAGERPLAGFNDLTTTDPELAEEWAETNKRTPDTVMKKNAILADWKCPTCGGIYSAKICDREVGDDSCPFCAGERPLAGFNDLTTTDPELAGEWAETNERTPDTVMKKNAMLADWKCPTCGGIYSARICDREVGDDSCPFCADKRALTGYNDLATTDPELAKEWAETNERTPDTVMKKNAMLADWKCPTCGGIYSARICDREVGDDSCPFCADKRALTGYNDLTTTDPELAKEWAETNDRKPDTVMKKNAILADWKCPTCGGIYSARICDREVGDDSCPFCAERKALPGYNDFATKHPDLMEEWQSDLNSVLGLDPNMLTDKSLEQAWWKCKKCGFLYHMPINRRVHKEFRGQKACPKCNGRTQWRPHC
jgi:rubrerythrin